MVHSFFLVLFQCYNELQTEEGNDKKKNANNSFSQLSVARPTFMQH